MEGAERVPSYFLLRGRRLYSVAILQVLRCNRGATSIEYALIATLVSIAIIGGVTASGDSLQASLENTLAQIVAAFG